MGLLRAVVLATVLAHVPVVGPAERAIEDPARSWAYYDELPADGTHTWTFELREGEPLLLLVGVPVRASWDPEARLDGPAGPITLDRGEARELEPFGPSLVEERWSLRAPAPATGTYMLTIEGEGGPYVLGYGLAEAFTPAQWVSIPLQAARIHAWERIPGWAIAAPYVLGLAGAAALASRESWRALLPRLGAGLFAGSALERALLLALAARAGAEASALGWIAAIALCAPGLVLAVAAWRARRVWTLAATGAAGLLLWAGFLVGPALTITGAFVRAWRLRPHERHVGLSR